jgi:hypothetical protein
MSLHKSIAANPNLKLMGTIKEIAEQMGVSEVTIRFQTTPSYRKRCREDGTHREVFPIDD